MNNKLMMKSNPGGQIYPKDAVGRASLVSQIWEILEGQSIYINAERRIGKTTVLSILEAHPRKNWFPVKRDLEGIHSADEFAATVYRDVEAFLPVEKRVTRKAKDFLESIGGVEFGSILKMPDKKPVPWKTLLEKSIQDLDDAFKDKGQRVLFLWDEVPFMLKNICDSKGETSAMEWLNQMRYLRQTYSASLRMVLTGSIGLHHVLSVLKGSGYANAPLNDLYAVEVGPLDPERGKELAVRLLRGEGLENAHLDEAATLISQQADHFPYYIHHLVKRLKLDCREATPSFIEAIVRSQLVDSRDPWELRHYLERITTYYGHNERLVLAILDALAVKEYPLSQDELITEAKSVGVFEEKETARKVLKLLEQDHYVRRNETGRYNFRFELIRRWWKLERGLESWLTQH